MCSTSPAGSPSKSVVSVVRPSELSVAVAMDDRPLLSSVSAAALCAHSCLRFCNSLLLPDASSSSSLSSSDLSADLQNPQRQDFDDAEWSAMMDAALSRSLQGESYMRPRSLHWWNHYVGFAQEDDPRYADVFRLPVGFFTTVCSLAREDMQQGDIPLSLRNIEGRLISVEKQVAIAVMRLTSGSTIKSISQLLGCGKSTVVKIVNKFVGSIRQRASNFLQWPANAEKLTEVKDGFYRKHGLVNCCGAIDATHVRMELPAGESSDVWVDRNHNFSMILQAIVDTELRFLDVCIGYPGSLSHARCLRESAFYRRCCNGQRLNGDSVQVGETHFREYIVGDWKYPLLRWLMKTYRQTELTPPRVVYNEKMAATRIVVARAFGRLKGTWRILQGTLLRPNIERLPKMIHACCILHNMCIDAGGVEGVHFPEPELVSESDAVGLEGHDDDDSDEAKRARDDLCMYMNSLQ